MRLRSTFVLEAATPFNPDDIKINTQRLSLAGLGAAREERLTFGLEELPEELQEVLRHAHELHVRWAPEYAYQTKAPFFSRLSPGLHVFYTPLEGHSDDLICPLIRKAFSSGNKCHSPSKTFIQPPILSQRFTASSALQYYAALPSLSDLVAYIQRNVCLRSDLLCTHTASLLNIADSLDIDYDSISHIFTLNAFWSKPPAVFYDPIGEWTTYDAWNLDVQQKSKNDRVEVGILAPDTATDAHDLQLSGFLTVVGEDEQPKPTRFHFPSRHHILPSLQLKQQPYTVSVLQPQGLHPTLQLSFPKADDLRPPENRPEGSQCALQSYLTLPASVFIDEYAFRSNDPLFAEMHKIRATRAIAGETDLEAPDYVIDKWGSIVLLDVTIPSIPDTNTTSTANEPWQVTVPLHLRYLAPSQDVSSSVQLPWPIVYWACTAEEGTKFPINPFDRVNLGFDGLYGPRTMFYHLEPRPAVGERVVEQLSVPVYPVGKIDPNVIEVGTLAMILAGFIWVAAKLWPGLRVQASEAFGSSPAGDSSKKKQ